MTTPLLNEVQRDLKRAMLAASPVVVQGEAGLPKSADAHLAGAVPTRTLPPAQPIDTGDHVHHGPSAEDWVVAYVRGDKLCACGWPCTLADLSDCTLIKKATPAERDKLLREMADMDGGDSRGVYARERLAAVSAPSGSADAPEAADRWIPVSERLPAFFQPVALMHERTWLNTGDDEHNINKVDAGYLQEFGNCWMTAGSHRGMTLDAFTHWTPLPPGESAGAVPTNEMNPASPAPAQPADPHGY